MLSLRVIVLIIMPLLQVIKEIAVKKQFYNALLEDNQRLAKECAGSLTRLQRGYYGVKVVATNFIFRNYYQVVKVSSSSK